MQIPKTYNGGHNGGKKETGQETVFMDEKCERLDLSKFNVTIRNSTGQRTICRSWSQPSLRRREEEMSKIRVPDVRFDGNLSFSEHIISSYAGLSLNKQILTDLQQSFHSNEDTVYLEHKLWKFVTWFFTYIS